MTAREDVARAMAYFESSDDIGLLHEVIADVAPRAKRMVAKLMASGGEDGIPAPADLRAARTPATQAEAWKTVRGTNDFALLQVLARTAGRRLEALEIVASAELPEGTRVRVPERPSYPPTGPSVEGTVESTGTSLHVLLDNGETWQGPPSLATVVREG